MDCYPCQCDPHSIMDSTNLGLTELPDIPPYISYVLAPHNKLTGIIAPDNIHIKSMDLRHQTTADCVHITDKSDYVIYGSCSDDNSTQSAHSPTWDIAIIVICGIVIFSMSLIILIIRAAGQHLLHHWLNQDITRTPMNHDMEMSVIEDRNYDVIDEEIAFKRQPALVSCTWVLFYLLNQYYCYRKISNWKTDGLIRMKNIISQCPIHKVHIHHLLTYLREM